MRFLVDAQLPPALARLLSSLGHAAVHVADVGLKDASDSRIWDYSLENDLALITKDEDLPRRCRLGGSAPVVIRLRKGNTGRRALLEWFEPLLSQIEKSIREGVTLIEVS